jgi:arylsulfatase A-like enzyme
MPIPRFAALLLVACAPSSPGHHPNAPPAPVPVPTPVPAPAPVPTTEEQDPANVLLVVIDDVGVQSFKTYGIREEVASTPHVDALAANGVTFLHAYGNAACSPTRAMIQTGRHAFRTGIGHVLSESSYPLQPEEMTLAEMVAGRNAASMVGKWHLGGHPFLTGPNDQGWEWYGGTLIGVEATTLPDIKARYDDWEKVTNGVPERVNDYATTVAANDAIARMDVMPEPWLLVVTFNAAHAPHHWPPDDLWTGELHGDIEAQQQVAAMVEAMDTELGRILDALPSNTLETNVIFMGDNGEPAELGGTPHGKGTMYEAGVRLPLIVSGPAVRQPGTETHALVSAVDILPTVAELLDIDLATIPDLPVLDGTSFVPQLRDPTADRPGATAFSEQFVPSGPPPWRLHDSGARNHEYRLVRRSDVDELYAIGEDFIEGEDLLADGTLSPTEQAAYDELSAVLARAVWEE